MTMSTRCFFVGGTIATFSAPDICISINMQLRQMARTDGGDDSARHTPLPQPEQASTRDSALGSSISDTSTHNSGVDGGGFVRCFFLLC